MKCGLFLIIRLGYNCMILLVIRGLVAFVIQALEADCLVKQLLGMVGRDFLLLHISHRGLLQLELPKLFQQVGPLGVILPPDLLKKPLVRHLPQKLSMRDELHFLLGAHQASSHQQQTLLPVGVQCQVYEITAIL